MIASIVLWLLVLELLGLAAYPLVRRALGGGVESSLAASKIAGLVLFGVIAWCGNWFFHLPLAATNLQLLLLGFIGCGYVLQRADGGLAVLRSELAAAKRSELLYLVVFLVFLTFRSLQPEIFWGEKPMDFTLLNYCIRLESLPPVEPWAAGLTLNYYYLGFFLFSLIHKIAAIDSALGFNLSVVTVGALITCATLTALLEAGVRPGLARAGALAVTFLSNWEVWRLFWSVGQKAGFDLFWASSRLFTSPAFSEYPLWSILFADLHAHVMAIPVAVLSLACTIRAAQWMKEGGAVTLPLLHGLLLGALYGINAWDLLSQVALLGGILGASVVLGADAPVSSRLGRMLEYLLTAGLAAVVFIIPFRASLGPGPQIEYGWVLGEFNDLSQIARYLGQWIVPLGLAVVALVLRLSRTAEIHYGTFAAALLVGAVPLVLGQLVASQLQGLAPPRSLLCALSAGLFCATIAAACRELSSTQRVGAILLAAALLMITMVELVFVMDRMNTIFKFYIPIWFVCGVSFFTLIPGLGQRSGCIARTLVAVTVVAALGVAAIGSAINLWAMALFHRVPEAPRPTLNGMAYHAAQRPDRYYLLQWMRREIKGQPTIIEAFGSSYGGFTRIAMNTGLPTVLGWEHHVSQRGVSRPEIEVRKRAINEFYSTSDLARASQIIDRYQIAYVVVGEMEREGYRMGTYSSAGLKKFSEHKDLFVPVFQSGGEVLYATRHASSRSKATMSGESEP
ncbi:MAG: hypothetical protein EBZ48_05480 [Proteobacteria bacterium]|nr:hypothetical protein [Pseudomonadota bacterium]